MTLSTAFAASAGSIVGREHVRLLRNNQDAAALSSGPGQVVAVVADGCSSGRASEVGARLGAAWLAHWLPSLRAEAGSDQGLAEAAAEGLLGYLRTVAEGLQPGGVHPEAVGDHLLFTFIAAVVDPERTRVFGIGDGVISLNGEVRRLPAPAGNAPPYLGYRLVPASLVRSTPGGLVPVLHAALATADLDSLLIATDGAADLPDSALQALVADPGLERNPYALQRRLVVLGERERRLGDDTTAIVLRRRRP